LKGILRDDNVDFVTLSPTGNITVIVKTPVARSLQAETGARLLEENGVFAEQVGFMEPAVLPGARARLQMCGGEFCGNGAMAMAAYIAREDGLTAGGKAEIPLEVSGAADIVACRIEALDKDVFSGTVEMPLPYGITHRNFNTPGGVLSLWTVSFPGITHVILPLEAAKAFSPDPKAFARSVIRRWDRVIGSEALGIMLLDEKTLSMSPLVFVAAPNTLFWETGCGSGTAAAGVYLAHIQGRSGRFKISQPGGTITVSAKMRNGKFTGLSISGKVKLITEGRCIYNFIINTPPGAVSKRQSFE
jgi:diaminopimelate epimerase